MNNSNSRSVVFGLACVFYLLSEPFLAAETSAIFKIIPILLLCALTIKSEVHLYKLHLLIALAFSMGGDVLLELGLFVPGLVSFLVAQLVYAGLFLRCHSAWLDRLPISLALLAFSVAMGFLMWGNAGEMRIPVLAYLVVITLMGLSANTSHIKTVIVGAAIFIFSDSIIALNRFVLPIPAADWLIMVSYYLAQYCLVTSILHHKTAASDKKPQAD